MVEFVVLRRQQRSGHPGESSLVCTCDLWLLIEPESQLGRAQELAQYHKQAH